MKSEMEQCFDDARIDMMPDRWSVWQAAWEAAIESERDEVVRRLSTAECRRLMELAGEVERTPEIKPSAGNPFICHKHGR